MNQRPTLDNHYAIVVGINEYPGVSDLQQAVGDAAAFVRWLRAADGGNLPNANIRVVRGRGPFTAADSAQPTREAVVRALRKVYKELKAKYDANARAWRSSRLYFYGAGHGLGRWAAEAALLMANADGDAWNENVGCRAYLDYCLDNKLCRELIFFADCCRHDKAKAKPMGPVGLTWDPFEYDEAVDWIIGLAAEPGHSAYETPSDAAAGVRPDERRSYFTRALLEGLRHGAIDPASGRVTTNALANYVKRVVRERSQADKRPQSPQFIGEADGFVLASRPIASTAIGEVPGPRTYTVTINFASPPPMAGAKLRLSCFRDGREHATDLDPAVAAGPIQLKLPENIYHVAWTGGPATNRAILNDGRYFRVVGGDRDVHV